MPGGIPNVSAGCTPQGPTIPVCLLARHETSALPFFPTTNGGQMGPEKVILRDQLSTSVFLSTKAITSTSEHQQEISIPEIFIMPIDVKAFNDNTQQWTMVPMPAMVFNTRYYESLLTEKEKDSLWLVIEKQECFLDLSSSVHAACLQRIVILFF